MSDTLWLTARSPLLETLLFGGGLTVLVGALLALTERRVGRFIAYLSLVALGQGLIGLSLGTRNGVAGTLLVTLNPGVGGRVGGWRIRIRAASPGKTLAK